MLRFEPSGSLSCPAPRRPRRRGSLFEFGFGLDLGAELVALLVDAGDHRPHGDAEVDEHRLRKLQRRLERLRHRVGDAGLVEPRGVRGIAGAGDDRQLRDPAANASRDPR